MAIITPAHQAAVVALYTALFNRAPDADGLAFWAQAYADGASLDTISQGFVASPESNALYPASQTDTEFVTGFYTTVFGRAPDPEGLAFWLASLGNLGGAGSPAARAGLVSQITNVVNTPLTEKPANMSDADYQRTLADRGTFANKNAAGIDFAVNLKSNDVELAKKVTSVVTDDPSSINVAKTVAETGVVPPVTPVTPPSTGPITPPVVAPKFDLEFKNLEASQGTNLLYAGSGNSSTGFVVATNTDFKLELGLDVRFAGNPAEVPSVNGAAGRFLVDAASASSVRFAYSAASLNGDLDLTKYEIKLYIDSNGTAGEQFTGTTFTLKAGTNTGKTGTPNFSDSDYIWVRDVTGTSITDDGGTAAVTQNIQAITWYNGNKPLALGDQYTVKLQATSTADGAKIAESIINIDVAPLKHEVTYGDLSSKAIKEGFLYAGSGNPTDGFVLSTNTAANLQLGLDARLKGNSQDITPTEPGVFKFDATAADSVRFAYSVASLDGALDLEKYDFQLKIDRDAAPDAKPADFLTFNLTKGVVGTAGKDSPYDWVGVGAAAGKVISDDGGSVSVSQNIQALFWYADGNQTTQAPGSYAVELTATMKGTSAVVAHTEIILLIAEPQ